MTFLFILLFFVLNILDLITTNMAIKAGLYEYNFVLNLIYKWFGFIGHVVFKLFTCASYIISLYIIPIEGVLIINIVFALVVLNNIWELINVSGSKIFT